ncbi:MAG: hypothetical protein ABIF10_02120 [Candidatus Woesearchaeota archaeon]
MIPIQDLKLVALLRTNARGKLTAISRKICMPVSTIFEKLKKYEGKIFKKYVVLVDFSQFGYVIRANICLRVAKEHKEGIMNYLKSHQNVNSLLRINNGFDYMVEAYFEELKGVEEFIEILESRFKIEEKQIFYILDDIIQESFMSKPEMCDILSQPS